MWRSGEKNEKVDEKIDVRMPVEACIQFERNLRTFIDTE